MEKIFNQQVVIEELRRAFDKKIKASDVLDSKLRNVFNSSSIVFVIVSAIITSTLLNQLSILYWIGLSIVFILYLITVFKIKEGQKPYTFHNPISNDINELNQKFINTKREKTLDILIRSYLYFMYEAGVINNEKEIALRASSNLMFLIIILLFISILLGLIFPALKLSDILIPITNFVTRTIL